MRTNKDTSFPWNNLITWYKKNWRHHLPWRQYDSELGTQNPEWVDASSWIYRIWLSEILLQQTQVDRVIPYLEKILLRYPTIHDLAKASYEEFFPYYQGMGYYSRARNILKTSQIISEEYEGVFPNDIDLLIKLPWVWLYTSSAILAFGYWESKLAWDTNLEKVFSRYYKGRKDIKLSTEEKVTIEEDFKEFIKSKNKWEREYQSWDQSTMDWWTLLLRSISKIQTA